MTDFYTKERLDQQIIDYLFSQEDGYGRSPLGLFFLGAVFFWLAHSAIEMLLNLPLREFNLFIVGIASIYKKIYIFVAAVITFVAHALLRTTIGRIPEINLFWLALPVMLSTIVSVIFIPTAEYVIYLVLIVLFYAVNHWQRKSWVLYTSFITYFLSYAFALYVFTNLYFGAVVD